MNTMSIFVIPQGAKLKVYLSFKWFVKQGSFVHTGLRERTPACPQEVGQANGHTAVDMPADFDQRRSAEMELGPNEAGPRGADDRMVYEDDRCGPPPSVLSLHTITVNGRMSAEAYLTQQRGARRHRSVCCCWPVSQGMRTAGDTALWRGRMIAV